MSQIQQENINKILGAYTHGNEPERAHWREIASRVYANALRDDDISALEIKMTFDPLARIASAASFAENAQAVGQALAQPITHGIQSMRTGGAWTATAIAVLKMNDDPWSNVKDVWHGVESFGSSIKRLAEHGTGFLSMEERARLADIYDLPASQRLPALHGVTLQDTTTMVSAGSLPGLLPHAMTSAEAAISGTASRIVKELHELPVRYGTNNLPVLAGAGTLGEAGISAPIMAMASKNPPNGGNGGSGETRASKPFDITQYEIPDPNFDVDRYIANVNLWAKGDALSKHLDALKLKSESKLLNQSMEYLLTPQIVQTDAEYQLLTRNLHEHLQNAGAVAYDKAISAEKTVVEAIEAGRQPMRMFEKIEPLLAEERAKRVKDLQIEQAQFARQQAAKSDPDSVGYHREPEYGSIEAQIKYPTFHGNFRKAIDALGEKLQALGMGEQAESMRDLVADMRHVTLEDSVTHYRQQGDLLMAIGDKAKAAEITNVIPMGYTTRGLEKIREDIGKDFASILDSIEYDREYHIQHHLWDRQRTEERHVTDSLRYAELREKLFGITQDVDISHNGPER